MRRPESMPRLWLVIPAWLGLVAGGGVEVAAEPPAPAFRLRPLGSELFLASPRAGVAIHAVTSYVRPDGLELVGYHSEESKSDLIDICWQRFSPDNGATWSEPVPFKTCEEHADGTLRRHMRGSSLDPASGRLITIWTEGVLPTDEPLEGLRHYAVHYSVSTDGGRTEVVRGPIVQAGDGFSPEHPLPGVWRGRSCVMIGDYGCTPLTLADGTILVPCQISPVGPDGTYHNPGGGYTYTDAAVIRGRWRPDHSIAWELSAVVAGDPERSTRGMIEPTLGVLDDGRVLMVMRGSNGGSKDPRWALPGYRWHAVSADGGRTWTAPEPWTYDDGEPFFSPSSCSQFVRHSRGGLFWIGNICPQNPRDNRPRYPLVIGEVDTRTGRLRRASVVTVDDRRPGEAAALTLSNFFAREDRRTGDIVIHLTRLFAGGGDWTADARLFRVAVEGGPEGDPRPAAPEPAASGLPAVPGIEPPPPPAEPQIQTADDAAARAAAAIGLPEGFAAQLFAAEPLVANPVAFSIDERGRVFVCEAFRAGGRGVFDNNGRDDAWIDADLATQSVGERFAMLLESLGDRARDAVVESDRLRQLVDADGDGVADGATVFATGFNRLVAGHGAGVLARRGSVLYASIPDLWRLDDADDDGVADGRTVLHTGYGVRVAFHGHDLHGLTPGPDGRIYFTIGDRGYRVAHEGRVLADAESGAVLRCEPDGSRLEVVHTGLRNPQELAFDDLGNLFTVDNNSDSGDRARLVQIVPGGDSGWRMSFQYMADRGPFGRERIWHLANADQPADLVPPLAHLSSGPAGLAAYPGTGLTPHFAGRFLLADFRGAAAGSGVRTFRVRPQGASFAACDEEATFRNLLATDVEVGPDGAVWVSDWVHGWDGEGRGRIWRFVPRPSDPAAAADRDRVVAEVRDLLAGDWAAIAASRLAALLGHADRRVRLEAQWELARRGDADGLAAVAADASRPLLARVHAIQGLGQIGRREASATVPAAIAAALGDPAWELRLVAARTIGEFAGDATVIEPLVPLLADDHPHVRAAAAFAIAGATRGATGPTRAEMLTANLEASLVDAIVREAGRAGGSDPHARHAIAMAVTATADAAARARLARHPEPAVRLVACVAMRRTGDPAIAALLDDDDAAVAVEAARGIHDVPIAAARPALAARLLAPPAGPATTASDRDAFLRRAIAASEREATPAAAARLAAFVGRADMPTDRRLEAADVLRRWAAPPRRDRVLGMWRPCPLPRDRSVATTAVAAALPQLLGSLAAEGAPALPLRQAVLEAAASLGVESAGDLLAACCDDVGRGPEPRAAALAALAAMADPRAAALAARLSRDAAPLVRLAARRVQARTADAAARATLARELGAVVTTPADDPAAVRERQDAVDLLAALDDDEARRAIAALRGRLDAGTLDPRLALEVREASADAQSPTADSADLLAGGDPGRGHAVFLKTAAGECVRCHRVGGTGGDVGPALDGIGGRRDRRHLLESIVAPSVSIADGYRTAVIVTTDGRTVAGVVREEDADSLVVTAADGTRHRIARAAIEERSDGGSAMPADLATKLTRREIRDLVAWLASLTAPSSP